MRILQGLIVSALLGVVLSAASLVDVWLPGGPRVPALPIIGWILFAPAGFFMMLTLSRPQRIGPLRWGGQKLGPLVRALPSWVLMAAGAVLVAVAVNTVFALPRDFPRAQLQPFIVGLDVLVGTLAAAGAYGLWLGRRSAEPTA